MYETGADFSNSFRRLARLHTAADVGDWLSLIQKECSSVSEMKALYKPKIPKEYQFLFLALSLAVQNVVFILIFFFQELWKSWSKR